MPPSSRTGPPRLPRATITIIDLRTSSEQRVTAVPFAHQPKNAADEKKKAPDPDGKTHHNRDNLAETLQPRNQKSAAGLDSLRAIRDRQDEADQPTTMPPSERKVIPR